MVGGLATGVIGAGISLLAGIVRVGLLADPGFLQFMVRSTLNAGIAFFIAGASVSMTFGAALAITAHDRSLRDLPLWRLGLLGASVAAVLPAAIVLALGGWGAVVSAGAGLASFSAWFGGFGGILTTGLVAIAKHAERRDLAAGEGEVARLEA